jgi:succinyl-CoA synthetase alpha subunit
VGHAWSGGNVVFGTSPGRRGQTLGEIPVYNSVREGLEAGHRFNCGVVYLPPAAARDGVTELIRINPELRKIFIVTEKMPVRDSREIRALGQQRGVDIFGANSLGVADSWNQVRIGGALGGDHPGETLRKGSIAIHSNSGGFTTTIAGYLLVAGWGTTTLISSGKDVYIHFAAPEFAWALGNDPRSKAAVLYCEPGGHYELDAHFTKPVIACVVGRWKSMLTRAVGHAGALAGGDDDAAAKERWFMEKLGVEAIFTPDRPAFSPRGAVVTNIAHVPQALAAVMEANSVLPDFAPQGSLALKPWFASNAGLSLPRELDLPVVEAVAPYGAEIAQLDSQIGAVFPRQAMKDASGASRLDGATEVASLYGVSMLEAAGRSLESNLCLALLHEPGNANDHSLIGVAVGAALHLEGDPALAAAQAAREEGNAPNAVISAALSILGPRRAERSRIIVTALIEAFARAGLDNVDDEVGPVELGADLRGTDARAELMLAGLRQRAVRSAFVRCLPAQPSADAVLAAICATLAWEPLRRRRISLVTATNLPWLIQLLGAAAGASVEPRHHRGGRFCGLALEEIVGRRPLAEVFCRALLGREPGEDEIFAFETLIGLLLTGNGPGAISLQGAKGAVSADGPETPERVQLNKAMIGFLTHCGYAHGGNGYEGIAFLLERFAGVNLADPGDRGHGLDVRAMARRYAEEYAQAKKARRDLRKIPGVHHPVFRDKPVNVDPREEHVRLLLESRGEYNVFHEFYRALVEALFEAGVSSTVYCVNIDAVIAALLLKVLWKSHRSGACTQEMLETAAFTLFLCARMIGSAAEIDDHLNRGRNMDTRTPARHCRFVT